MSTIGQGDANAAAMLTSMMGKHVCPFCGTVRDRRSEPCPRCTMEDSPETRQATRNRIGPWYVLQARNPSAPGMKFETLLLLVRRGQVTPRSIVRGPTTHQLWRFAIRVRGLSREWGLCYHCGQSVEPTDNACPHCHKIQEPPLNPDVLLESQVHPAPPPARLPAAPRPQRAISTQIVLPVLGEIPADKSRVPEPRPTPAPPASPAQPAKAPPADAPPPPPERSPRTKNTEKLLSPRDLAAAFSLDFNAATKAPEPTPRRRGRVLKVIGLLILLGILGLVAALALHPPFRRQVFEPISRYLDEVKPRWQKPSSVPAPTPKETPEAAPEPQAKSPVPPPPPQEQTTPPVQPGAQPLSLQKLPLPPVTSSAPAESAAPPAVPASTPSPTQPATPPESKTPPPAPSPAQNEPEETNSPIDRSDQVRQLWIKAIDAEGSGDLAGAIKIYEKIQTFPSDLWPVSLELRLEQAKKQLQNEEGKGKKE